MWQAGSKGKQYLLLICPKEAYRKLVHRYFKSGVLPSSPLNSSNNIDKLSGLKGKNPPTSKGSNGNGKIY